MSHPIVQRFERNVFGRDFVVGDLHGCFDLLCEQMDRVGFDPKTDRIFSVGDLVDRGTQSKDALNWMAQPWFHAVRGNHEEMAIYYPADSGKKRVIVETEADGLLICRKTRSNLSPKRS